MSSPESYTEITTQSNLLEWLIAFNDLVEDYINNREYISDYAIYKTSDTGSLIPPVGTEAERDVSSSSGYLRFNTDVNLFEYYNGSEWKYITSLDAYYDTLDIASTPYNGSGNITEIVYDTGHKQTFTYTGLTKIDINYYNSDGITLISTNTINFDGNGNITTTSWA
jgi:hypothetical protein